MMTYIPRNIKIIKVRFKIFLCSERVQFKVLTFGGKFSRYYTSKVLISKRTKYKKMDRGCSLLQGLPLECKWDVRLDL